MFSNFVSHTEIQLANIFKVYEEPEEVTAEEEEPAPAVEEEEYEAPPPPAPGICQGLLHGQESVAAWVLCGLHTTWQYPSSTFFMKFAPSGKTKQDIIFTYKAYRILKTYLSTKIYNLPTYKKACF